jgi:hypothetical protein
MGRRLPLRALLLCGLAVGLGLPADADARSKKRPRPAVEEKEEIDVEAMLAAREEVFGAVNEAFDGGRKKEAADLLVEVVQNEEHAQFHAEAYFRLGGLLESFDLPYSALVAYEKALAADAPMVKEAAAKAIALADKVGDTALLEDVFSRNLGLEVDAKVRSRMAYLAARESFARGVYPLAMATLKMVDASDPYFPEAKALEGVALAQMGRHQDALVPLQVALGSGKALKRGQRFNDMINLNLARAYYGANNFPRAIEYFGNVQRDSLSWPEAQFERAWAFFRLEDTNGALSQLETHVSPFLAEHYFPEASLLRVYSLFLMCKFTEASKQIKSFQTGYSEKVPVLDEVAAQNPRELFQAMASKIEEDETELPEMIWSKYLEEDRFNDSLAAVRSSDDEAKRLENVAANPFSDWAKEQVMERRKALVKAEGERIRSRAERMAAELREMLQAAELSALDMLDFETRLYSQAAARGDMLDAREVVNRKSRVKANQRAWPWEGEYWADEVGYYRIESEPDCPASMRQGLER